MISTVDSEKCPDIYQKKKIDLFCKSTKINEDKQHEHHTRIYCVFQALSFLHFSRLVKGFIIQLSYKSVNELNRSHQSEHHFSTIHEFLKKGKWSHEFLLKALFIWFLDSQKFCSA